MPDQFEAVIYYVSEGMNAAVHPSLLPKTSASRMTNCRIVDQLPATRYGIRFYPLDGDVKDFINAPLQGACYFNPSQGQTQQHFGQDQDSIIVAAGGKKFQLLVNDATGTVEISNITGGLVTSESALIVHMFQAEYFLIAQDGISDCWIWPGEGAAFFSAGYNTTNKLDSKLANGAVLGAYAHGRIIQVIDGNRILVGDIIFKNNLTTAVDILGMTEQVYFATGANFASPTMMGDCRAIDFLPLRNTLYGHADVLLHENLGVMSLDISQYPRSNWANLQLTSIALLNTGAQGPYALALYNGDQIFRSRAGIQSLRSAAATDDLFGNPQTPTSEPVNTWFNLDPDQLLRFTSCAKWTKQNRFMSTVGQWTMSKWRGADGIVLLNFMPLGSVQPQPWAWEGLWTLPPGRESVVQIVNALIRGKDRTFIIGTTRQNAYNAETGELTFKNYVAEIDPNLIADVLEDGTESPISCQVATREFSGPDRTRQKTILNGTLSFREIQGDLIWGVWVRADSTGDWKFWRGGISRECEAPTVSADECVPLNGCQCVYQVQPRESTPIGLGEPPIKDANAWQFLVRWSGCAQLEYLRVSWQPCVDTGGTMSLPQGTCSGKRSVCGNYSDFEYSNPERWEAAIK